MDLLHLPFVRHFMYVVFLPFQITVREAFNFLQISSQGILQIEHLHEMLT